ncbi:hypothetical protein D3C72_1633640 [compost metagenome]
MSWNSTTSLPASCKLPCTVDSSMRSIGKCSLRASLALPVAVVSSVKCSIQPSTGLAVTYLRNSCIGPAALPSMSSKVSNTVRSGITALTFANATPPVVAVSPRISMRARSNTKLPLIFSACGHRGALPASGPLSANSPGA